MKKRDPWQFHNKRASDNSWASKIVEDPWARLMHQALSVLAACFFGIFGYLAVNFADTMLKKMDNTEAAVLTLSDKVEGKFGSYDSHFVFNDQRITRLEDLNDDERTSNDRSHARPQTGKR